MTTILETVTNLIQSLNDKLGYVPSSLKGERLQLSVQKLGNLLEDIQTFSQNLNRSFSLTQLQGLIQFAIEQKEENIQNIHNNIAADRMFHDPLDPIDFMIDQQLRDIEALEDELQELNYEQRLLGMLMNLGSQFLYWHQESSFSLQFCDGNAKHSYNFYTILDFVYCVQLSYALIRCLYQAGIVDYWLYHNIAKSMKKYKRIAEGISHNSKQIFEQFSDAGLRDIYMNILPNYIIY